MTPPCPTPRLHLRGVTLGPFATNCYLLWTDDSPDAWIIDAGFGAESLAAEAAKLNLNVTHIILTHAHVDHIAGVDMLSATLPAKPQLLIHEAEKNWLTDAELNLSALSGMPTTCRPADRLLKDGDALTLNGLAFEVRHTPGHSPGGITLFCPGADMALVGDALFAGSIGRTDFPGSDFDTLERSIRAQLYTLPDATKVYPGHGPATTINREKLSNPYVRG